MILHERKHEEQNHKETKNICAKKKRKDQEAISSDTISRLRVKEDRIGREELNL